MIQIVDNRFDAIGNRIITINGTWEGVKRAVEPALKQQTVPGLSDTVVKSLDTLYGVCRLQIYGGVEASVHLDIVVDPITLGLIKELKRDWEKIKTIARELGCNSVMTLFNESAGDGDASKWRKFVTKILGMPEPEVLYSSRKEL